MATNRISSEKLQLVLDYWAPLLTTLGAVPFFGTLLGLTRNGKPIENDDDVDFILPLEFRGQIEKLVSESDYEIVYDDRIKKNPWCIQAQKIINSEILVVDFYFYTVNSELEKLVLPFNFFNEWKNSDFHLHVPLALIFPLIRLPINSKMLNYPNKSQELVEFLYGPRWNIPLDKQIDYRLQMKDNAPFYRYPSKLEKWLIFSWRFLKKLNHKLFNSSS